MAPLKRSILITGCSDGGLGAALAHEMHRTGHWRVLASARSLKKMATLAAAGIETMTLDVLSEDSLEAGVAYVSELLGGSLDALLLNAGGGLSMPLIDTTLSSLRNLYELNVFAPLRTAQLFLPLLLKSTKQPLIINNTSCAALQPVGGLPWQAPYNSSKAASSSMTHSLRHELSPFGIKVVELLTASVKSNFFVNLANQTTASATAARLPEGSLYEPAKEDLEAFMGGGHAEVTAMDQTVYAKRVVSDLEGGWLGGGPPESIWRGTFASRVWLMHMFQGLVPGWATRWMVRDTGKVDVVERKVRAASKAKGKAS
ncbi:uncharacterized protein HMPREF1541_10336 [Cyphellophora europaea CBS 101466]|uniref:NADPH-dependent 1-acyldihydroxyacetone phosphate reductase n=1 Tax=Cyphellophora europaea (strain CBS 101466) TaxID=1220924 RepID=W2S7I0_CYPE1|nr:uncharacterized protein HMPREF1541_10336 [Cyphellophora europaea CBS 101466]ETN44666.1 hypothetical protein HMPREF1541_10336 [Cyphellophora europaea CBS 101466]